jgi:YVTN family beta-propeller protein
LGPDFVTRALRRRVAPLAVTAGLLTATSCIGIHHVTPTTTTVAHRPPHLIALVTLIGAGTSAGSGTTVEAVDLTANPVATRAITVGQFPDAVAIAPNGLTAYVTNYASNTVTPINLATGKAEKAINVGVGPAAIAITPNGKFAYVTNAGTSPIGNTVTPINLTTHKTLPPITVGDGPQGIAITPDGSMAYVANAGAVVTGQPGTVGSTVTPIDLATRTPGTSIKVGNAPLGVAVSSDGATVYVTNANSSSVTPIQAGAAGTPVPVDGSPQAIATSGATAWVADTSPAAVHSNNLSSIGPAATQAGTPIPLPKSPTAVAIAPGGKIAWVVSSGAEQLVPVDLVAGKVTTGSVALPGGPYAVALAEISAAHAEALTATPVVKKKAAR